MTSINPSQIKPSSSSCKVLVRDCSKYGTFINKNLGSMEKVHQFPKKETTLRDGDLISFGTGNATYRFSFVPLIFWNCCLETCQVNHPLQDKISSIGACIIHNFSQECTHVLVDEPMPLREDLLDAIVAKKPCILSGWVKLHYSPTLTVEGVSVKVTDPKTRENSLRGYTFVLDSTNKYKFGARLQSLLEVSGAKIQSIEGINLSSQAPDHEENNCIVCVIPGGSAEKFGCFSKLSSVSRVNEMDLISAVLSGQLDHSILRSPCVVVSSSCSTDETIVADSEAEVATVTLVHKTAAACSEELIETDTNVLPTTASTTNRKGLNFKRFRKKGTPSGNSFDNLIPFSKYPYQESDYRNEEIVESVKEEKKRKKMEAIAEDLFNNEKGRQRGTAGSLRALLSRC